MMLLFALRNLCRRRLRSSLTLFGLIASVGVLASLLAFGEGYARNLNRELNGMGMQMMLVPLGCPYEAAAGVLKGKALEVSLPQAATETARADRAVAQAAPLLLHAVPRPSEGRTDMWAGIDPSARALKPWWTMRAGAAWFARPDDVILGAEAAATELRRVGDTLFSPETGRRFHVAGILNRSGTSDDSLFFVPLATAQQMFHQEGRVTAVAIRLRDPQFLGEASQRLQTIPGAQVVTMTEMMGTFLNLLGSVRALVLAVAALALAISGLSVFNTMLTSVLERTGELGTLRAVGASRQHLFQLLTLEALMLTLVGSLGGLLVAQCAGGLIERVAKGYVPLAPSASLLHLSAPILGDCLLLSLGIGLLAGLYPAWRASRLQPAQALRVE